MSGTSPYPVHVDARLDPDLSRWRWLVKWLLALPHYVVLVFLGMAFSVLTFVAFFAILITGRYPRSLFDFNVGVLRWNWRVSCYGYGALATDRYPPFSLQEDAEYPAHLSVEYPERLSRGLVLVKWLLAIPHYLVLALLVGGSGYVAAGAADDPSAAAYGLGLISLLVLVAGVVLLFTGRYPRGVFDLVLGLDRWAIRVAAYVALMTDEYPPFRLDQGGKELSRSVGTEEDPSTAAAPRPVLVGSSPGDTTKRWTAGRVIPLVIGCVVLFLSMGVFLVSIGLAAVAAERDSDGYFMTDGEDVSSSGYAITSARQTLDFDASTAFIPEDLLGDVKVEVESEDGGAVFVGVAATEDVDRYLDGVRRAIVTDLADNPVLRTTGSAAPSTPPTDQDFWIAQSSGTGDQAVTSHLEKGAWTVVVMNADGSAGVDVEASVGATLPIVDDVGAALLLAAAVGAVLAVLLIAVVLWSARARTATRAAG